MASRNFSIPNRLLWLVLATFLPGSALLPAADKCDLTIAPPAKLRVKRGTAAEIRLTLKLPDGCHTNSDRPTDDFLIPFRLTWEPGVLAQPQVVYPKPRVEKYAFADQPLSVFTGAFEVVTRFQADAKAMDGPNTVAGKIRYQACTDKECLRPQTLAVQVPLVVF